MDEPRSTLSPDGAGPSIPSEAASTMCLGEIETTRPSRCFACGGAGTVAAPRPGSFDNTADRWRREWRSLVQQAQRKGLDADAIVAGVKASAQGHETPAMWCRCLDEAIAEAEIDRRVA